MKRLALTLVAGLGLMLSLVACNPVDEGIVRDHRIVTTRYTTDYQLRVMKPVSHDTDAHFWVSVPRIHYVRCDYGEKWEEDFVGGCDARVRENPPGW